MPLWRAFRFCAHYECEVPRNQRSVLPGLAYHITQRGTNPQRVLFTNSDRSAYLRFLGQNLEEAGGRLLARCLMPNHVHLVVVPERADSLAILLRLVHGRSTQMVNARRLRSGHLWQNRFSSCALSPSHP
jgi:putative transposase